MPPKARLKIQPTSQLILGDCLEKMMTLPAKSVDAIITDLPYGTTQNDWDSVLDLKRFWSIAWRVCKGPIITTASQPFTSVLVCSNLHNFRHEWIWEKSKAVGHLNAKKSPLKAHESVLVFSRYTPKYNPQKTAGKPYTPQRGWSNKRNYGDYGNQRDGSPDGSRYPRSILHFQHVSNPIHPTQKPVELFEYLISTYSDKEHTILDPCMGSGTTGVACKRLGRHFIGIEQEAGYFKISQERIDAS